ncbi:HEPN domain-containing protein [Faecalicatena contorta]|uniref:HEPN domain-containing protein n=3 Tax=Clostridia TaxID=186801 RepID=A0ABR9RLA2_9FIRM|nr:MULTISPECIES: HEPN domain-containing protein [Clostridia]MBE5063758.1 HEPN domain-containing protein [Claveliimonas monacensis]MBM6684810.1 HEPN domain-containing protein [Faecalicatena contorta]MBM6710007.1 HEPN domain-containing protein [Faecalicatena contorta]MBM6737810.1 HEPN domain-containing protein [Faecalicatena fissicatena]
MAGSIKDLSRYRYERSSEELENAKAMLETGKYKLALNRSYYSIFHGMRAVNVLDEFDSSKHSGVIAHFNQYHVKTGDFSKEASKIIRTSSEMREHADYEDFFVASRQDAEEQVQKAQTFHEFITNYLQKKEIL